MGLHLGVQNNAPFQMKLLSVIWMPCFEIHNWTKMGAHLLEERVDDALAVAGPDFLPVRQMLQPLLLLLMLRLLGLLHRLCRWLLLMWLWLLHRLHRWLLMWLLLLLRLAAAT